MSTILIGCDPEVFVQKNNVFLSAFGLIFGDKINPQRVANGAVQVDGMALEFNIDPAASQEEFLFNVTSVLSQMRQMVPEYDVVVSPVAHFTAEYMKDQPAVAKELGCDPDFNAWHGGAPNPKPDGERLFRTAAGHIHIGWTEDQDINDPVHQNRCNLIARELDFYLGLPSLFYDDDTQRREMYGKAGCIRYKSYGVEYRTLSNMWLQSPELIQWVYRNTVKCVRATMAGQSLSAKWGDIQDIVNSSNKVAAMRLIEKESLEMPNVPYRIV